MSLPRPVTPGPWSADDTYAADCGRACTPNGCIGHEAGRYLIAGPPIDDGGEFTEESDAVAIAALPEWIARCDRYEAALRDIAGDVTREEAADCLFPRCAECTARRALDGES